MTKRLSQDNAVKHLKTFLACRAILLDKISGVWTIGIGETLRHIIGKKSCKTFEKRCCKSDWVFTTLRKTKKEAVIYEVYEIINKEAVLIVDAWNPFSAINQLAFFHNSKILAH